MLVSLRQNTRREVTTSICFNAEIYSGKASVAVFPRASTDLKTHDGVHQLFLEAGNEAVQGLIAAVNQSVEGLNTGDDTGLLTLDVLETLGHNDRPEVNVQLLMSSRHKNTNHP